MSSEAQEASRAKKFKKGGMLYARVQKAAPKSAGKLALRLRGIKLKNVEGMFKKSDPFFEVRRTYAGPGGGSWTPVYRSQHVKNNLNPKWGPATIDVNVLCDGNLDRRLQVSIWDHEGDGKHDSMGAFETTVNELLKAAGSGTFTPKKGSKSSGTIAVDECKITGADTSTSETVTLASDSVVFQTTTSSQSRSNKQPDKQPNNQTNNQLTMTKEQLQLSLYASQLKNVAGIAKGTSDPFAIVTLLANEPNETPRVLGKTEVIKNSLSPNWTTAFLFDYELGKETHVNVQVIDEVRKTSDKPMGSAVFEIGDVLGSPGSVKAKKFKKGGILYARVQKAAPKSAGKLALRLRGIKLKNVEGMFNKSDPFFEARRTYDGPGGGSWTPVYRSQHVKNNLNPKWGPATIDVNTLCDGDLDRRLQVSIWDHEGDGKHDSMGAFETTVNELLKAAGSGTFTPKKGSKSSGTIAVDECKITGADTSTSETVIVNSAAADPSIPVMPVAQFGNMNLGGGAATPPRKPTFVDYISGNCELNMCVAIDFTGSNGDPRRPGTLHHFSPSGQMNGYEKAIAGVGNILAKYDIDQRFPVYGFGAKYDGVVRHCFQVGQEKEVHGVKGILDAYRGVFKTPLTMSGPTVFAEVIPFAAAQAKSRLQTHPLSYTILLLLTDGAVTDVQATKQALASIADAPLSIVIVGIGNADFSAMQFLDDFERRSNMNRDIVQFVQFNAHEYDKTSLTRATLEEIPDQLVQFFHTRGIMPQPGNNISTSRIPVEDYNEEADIDLSMDYRADGEIALNANQPAAFVDNSYEAGLGGVKIMAPPSTASQGYNPYTSAPAMAAPMSTASPGYNPHTSAPAMAAPAMAAPAMAAPAMAAPAMAAPTMAAPAMAAPTMAAPAMAAPTMAAPAMAAPTMAAPAMAAPTMAAPAMAAPTMAAPAMAAPTMAAPAMAAPTMAAPAMAAPTMAAPAMAAPTMAAPAMAAPTMAAPAMAAPTMAAPAMAAPTMAAPAMAAPTMAAPAMAAPTMAAPAMAAPTMAALQATLEEIPDQLVQFFHTRGIMPQPGNNINASRIAVEDYNEEADIDLSMDYGADGEIALNADQPAAFIDNSYEAGLGGVKIMAPPSTNSQGYNPDATAPVMTTPAMAPPSTNSQGYNPYASAPLMATPAPVPAAPQPFTFQIQVPHGVSPGMQIQVAHPQTGQPLIVAVPQGVPPGGVFSVSA
eukprot:CAMPEP_0196159234 /NCGR_PEP_ID=MMETSP0910-20130528/46210_1 /TAXON_ID=49265 /ORGANISM="Thalassiosira rotula, Strain GSO102" /LENGTH=1212 /DNA_ID=CAMNT_0041424151 /DNA_START=160 /DNA_END=3799 /DNA_ORIENTATION=+